jgi:hypothetical protein
MASGSNLFAVLSDETEGSQTEAAGASESKEKRPGDPPSSARGSAQKHFGFDRRSGTGRGREAAKKGAGGKYTFGSVEEDVRDALSGVKIASESDAAAADGTEKDDVNHVGESKSSEGALLSLEEYQQRLERERAELSNKLMASKGPRRPAEEQGDEVFRNAKRLDKNGVEVDADSQDALLGSISLKEKKTRAANRSSGKGKRDTGKENLAAEFFTAPPRVNRGHRAPGDVVEEDNPLRAKRSTGAEAAGPSRGRGRGRGGGSRGFRGAGARHPTAPHASESAVRDKHNASDNHETQEPNRGVSSRQQRTRGGSRTGAAPDSGRFRGRGRGGAASGTAPRPRAAINTTDDAAFPSLGA